MMKRRHLQERSRKGEIKGISRPVIEQDGEDQNQQRKKDQTILEYKETAKEDRGREIQEKAYKGNELKDKRKS